MSLAVTHSDYRAVFLMQQHGSFYPFVAVEGVCVEGSMFLVPVLVGTTLTFLGSVVAAFGIGVLV